MTVASLCTTLAACDAHDGERITVVGVYRLFPDPDAIPGDVPRAAQIVLLDGPGPFLAPYWHPEAVRPGAEVAQHRGRLVRVTGRYHRLQPRNPADPPHAAAMGGPCIHPIESIEPAEDIATRST